MVVGSSFYPLVACVSEGVKQLIRVEADVTSGDDAGVEWFNGIRGGRWDVSVKVKNETEMRRLREQKKYWNMPGGSVYVT